MRVALLPFCTFVLLFWSGLPRLLEFTWFGCQCDAGHFWRAGRIAEYKRTLSPLSKKMAAQVLLSQLGLSRAHVACRVAFVIAGPQPRNREEHPSHPPQLAVTILCTGQKM